MSDHASFQNRLLANAAALLGGGTWGLYPGECDYARRERWRSRSSPKKARSVDDRSAFFQAEIGKLKAGIKTARLDGSKTKKDVEVVERLLAEVLRDYEAFKREMRGGNRYGKGY